MKVIMLWPKLPELCWIVAVKVDTLVLFLTLGEMLQFFTIEDNVCCGFVIYSVYYVEVCSLYSCFLEGFYHKWMLNFVKGFICIYWDNHMAFIFQFVNVVNYIDWFVDDFPCFKISYYMYQGLFCSMFFTIYVWTSFQG